MSEYLSVSPASGNSRFAPPAKRYRIGEIASSTGISRQTVHNYTVMGLIRESQWTDGGHRLYDESVFSTLARIEQLKTTKSLREIRAVFDRERSGPTFEGEQGSRVGDSGQS